MDIVNSSNENVSEEVMKNYEDVMKVNIDFSWKEIRDWDETSQKSWRTKVQFDKKDITCVITKKTFYESERSYCIDWFFNDIVMLTQQEHTYTTQNLYIYQENRITLHNAFRIFDKIKYAIISNDKEHLKYVYNNDFHDLIEKAVDGRDAIRMISCICNVKDYIHTRNITTDCALCEKPCGANFFNCCHNRCYCCFCITTREFEENNFKDEYEDRTFTCPLCRTEFEKAYYN